MATLVLNEPEFTLYPPIPSTNICSLVTGLESVVRAETCTGELTVALFAGTQMVTVRLVVFSVHDEFRKKFRSLAYPSFTVALCESVFQPRAEVVALYVWPAGRVSE